MPEYDTLEYIAVIIKVKQFVDNDTTIFRRPSELPSKDVKTDI